MQSNSYIPASPDLEPAIAAVLDAAVTAGVEGDERAGVELALSALLHIDSPEASQVLREAEALAFDQACELRTIHYQEGGPRGSSLHFIGTVQVGISRRREGERACWLTLPDGRELGGEFGREATHMACHRRIVSYVAALAKDRYESSRKGHPRRGPWSSLDEETQRMWLEHALAAENGYLPPERLGRRPG